MNLYDLSMASQDEEVVEQLIPDRGIAIERIVSTGQRSEDGFWYNQERDEWVALLQGAARLSWPDGRISDLKAGDWLLIPAGEKHRVLWTSKEPPAVWLAVHGNLTGS